MTIHIPMWLVYTAGAVLAASIGVTSYLGYQLVKWMNR